MTGNLRLLAGVEAVRMRMRDGVMLAGDVYRPPAGRVPAILLRTPYGRDDLRARVEELDPLLAVRRGFAVVLQDLRGRGDSGGAFEPMAADAADGADTVAWIRRQPWSDGRVAMIGNSYDGCTQFQAARARPQGLVAIAPTVSGALRQTWYPGGALRLSGVDGWVARLLTEALHGELDAATRAEIEDILGVSELERFHAFVQPGTAAWRIAAPLRHWIAAPASDAYWAETTAVPDEPLPAVHTTGYYDVCVGEAIAAYEAWSAIADPAAPQLLTLGPWDHSLAAAYPQIGLDPLASPPASVAAERQLAFFDAMLGRTAADDLAPVTSFVLGRNRWHEGTRWPPADVRPLELALAAGEDGVGRLGREAACERRSVRYRYDPRDPVPTYGGAHAVWGLAGPFEQAPIESRSDVVTFSSEPLDTELEIAGPPTARLSVASSAPATDFIARLTLVESDGRSFPLVHGIWSGRPADLPRAGLGSVHRRCEIRLGSIHVAVAAGRRLRLQVTSSCYPDIYPNPNTGHDLRHGPPTRVQVAEQSLLVGGPDGSTLSLPVRGSAG